MSSYIDNLANAKPREDAEIDKALLQSRYFDRNGLRGNQNELKNQLNDIMAQTDYGKTPQKNRPTVIDKLEEGDPQDKLNEKQYALETSTPYNPNYDSVNPYIRPNINPYDQRYPSTVPRDQVPINPYIRHRYGESTKEWSLTKTIVIVVVLIGIFYLFFNMIFQDRVSHQPIPGDMNLPVVIADDDSNQ